MPSQSGGAGGWPDIPFPNEGGHQAFTPAAAPGLDFYSGGSGAGAASAFPPPSASGSDRIGGSIGGGISRPLGEEDEPSLLEGGPEKRCERDDIGRLLTRHRCVAELEIDPRGILRKALAVAIPTRALTHELEEDGDLAGPFFFSGVLGFLLLLVCVLSRA
jgi:hypothetical protein